MKDFAALFAELDATTSRRRKTDALAAYFRRARPADAAWALYFLAGGKPRQTVPTALVRAAARARAGIPEWLFDESYHVVGDLAETVAHVLPPAAAATDLPLHVWMEERLLALRGRSPQEIVAALEGYWDELDTPGRFLLTKLIGGSLRVGVSKLLVVRGLAEATGLDPKLLAQRLVGYTDKHHVPDAARFGLLVDPQAGARGDAGLPYPFFLAHPLQAAVETLGGRADWLAEWKWDGIRAQFIRRGAQSWLWSRGEDLLNGRFPEIDAAHALLPDGTVLDGEILVWRDGRVQPFAQLQQRIGRKNVTKKILAEQPVAFLAYDLLEQDGVDLRGEPQAQRRARLEALLAQVAAAAPDGPLRLSPLVDAPDWDALAALRGQSRARGVEGLMLKQREGRYGAGRTKDAGTWWKWKIDPYTVDAVLVYAQGGHGRRANLYTDYTFAVWDGDADDASNPRRLVPFAKAYSGLTDDEMRQVDQRIRQTTVERFGPVRGVTPTLVVELGFEGLQASPRHKSGVAVRFPRMLRLRWDKPVEEADSLATLKAFLAAAQGGSGAGAA
jgi:DNA ligase-1